MALSQYLYPFESPGLNAILATLYISGPPNFLLYLFPSEISHEKLNIMIAFAVGGLLGDVFLHLMPQIFKESELPATHVAFGILFGFFSFFVMDKICRIYAGGDHSHSHHHHHQKVSLDKNKKGKSSDDSLTKSLLPPSATLNLIADFTHNITDGIAIASSFYASKSIGSVTTAAVFFHEIPSEMGDCAILIRLGYTKFQAATVQFLTAIGALCGTLFGIWLHTAVTSASEKLATNGSTFADLLLPYTAGSFLYVACLSILPELLTLEAKDDSEDRQKANKQVSAKGKTHHFTQLMYQLTAITFGIALIASLGE